MLRCKKSKGVKYRGGGGRGRRLCSQFVVTMITTSKSKIPNEHTKKSGKCRDIIKNLIILSRIVPLSLKNSDQY